ncbi:hypothetical protein F4823DRAFT_558878 [Ustulina deusta]|nr:hypothetical protein F4823DRAFT_558878 [Ustulina deusta]
MAMKWKSRDITKLVMENSDRTQANLKKALATDGLMEHISIPWENVGFQDSNTVQYQWTVNLALWFVHILAGNDYAVDWNYDKLVNEQLAAETSTSHERQKRKRSNKPEPARDETFPKRVKSSGGT